MKELAIETTRRRAFYVDGILREDSYSNSLIGKLEQRKMWSSIKIYKKEKKEKKRGRFA